VPISCLAVLLPRLKEPHTEIRHRLLSVAEISLVVHGKRLVSVNS
jgi:hypothetical protein